MTATASGLLVPIGARTYRLGSEPRSWLGDVHGAALEVGGVASHRTAGALHGLLPQARPIEVVTPVARGGRSRALRLADADVVVHTTTSLPAADVLLVRGIPTTSVARSILGVAALGEAHAGSVQDLVQRALDRDLASLPWLWWLLEQRRCRGRSGVTAMEEALAVIEGLAPTESWLERRFLDLVRDHGLPTPATQRVIRRSRRFVGRVDFVWEDEKVVAEVLGYQFHRTRAQLDADTRRANQLQLLGYAALQFTFDAVVRSPMQVASQVDALLHR